MREAVKKIKNAKITALVGVSSLMLLMSACSSTQVLQDNGDVPAPSLNPPENANQIASPSQIEESLPPSTETVQLSSPVTQTAPVSQVKYTVKKGDSLWKVAKMFDVSVGELAAYNNIDPKSSLKTGQKLQIPPAGLAEPRIISTVPSTAAHDKSTVKSIDKTSASASGSTYTVKSGDSLWTVAKKNHVTIKKLAEANGLASNASLKVGQKLIIPGGKAVAKTTDKTAAATSEKKVAKTQSTPAVTPAPAATTASQSSTQMNSLINETAPSASTTAAAPSSATTSAVQAPSASSAPAPMANYLPHTVKDGDTWQTISDMYGVSIEDLKKVNPSIASDDQPKTGTVVNIPEE